MPADDLVATCREIARETGSTITLTNDVSQGAHGASAIYTDIWVSMGEPDELWEQRIKLLSPYQVSSAVMWRGQDTLTSQEGLTMREMRFTCFHETTTVRP